MTADDPASPSTHPVGAARARRNAGASCASPPPSAAAPAAARYASFAPDALELMAGEQHAIDDDGLDELADSLAVHGQLHALHVRQLGHQTPQILSGRRRWLAAQRLVARGVTFELFAWVHGDECDDDRADAIRTAENLHRHEPAAVETAERLMHVKHRHGYSHRVLAEAMGLHVSRVKEYLCIFGASPKMLDGLKRARLPIQLAAELVRYEKRFGFQAGAQMLKSAAAGTVTARTLAAKRMRRQDAAATSKGTDAWTRVAARVERLARRDPQGAQPHIEQLIAQLKALADTAVGS